MTMEVFLGEDARPKAPGPTVVTIGVFDGVHRGHAMLFATVVDRAKALGAAPAIVTFDPHPMEVIAPDRAPCVLTTLEQRLSLFEEHGFGTAVVLTFDEELASHTPEEFVRATLVEELHVARVVVGSDFRFGHGRAGDVSTLEDLGKTHGFEVEAIGLLADQGHRISSSDIRRFIAEGRVQDASALLGHPFRLAGVVVRGDARGRKLGFPTANLGPHPRSCLPGNGVYAGWWVVRDERLPGVINVGVRPTFGPSDRPLCEIHLLDFEGDLYGAEGEVEFTHFLRSEQRFEGVDALVEQVRRDADEARRLLTA